MLKRVLTTVVMLPILIGIVILGGVCLRIAILILSVIGLNEIYMSISKGNKEVHLIGYIFCVFYSQLLDDYFLRSLYVITSVFILTLLIYLVITHKKTNIIDCAVTMFGFYYVTFLLSNVYFVREIPEYGQYLVWLIFICAWASDTGAYFVGVNFGKRKLVPLLSPGKTVEGTVGGILSAGILAFVYGFVLQTYFGLEINFIWIFAVIGVIGAALSQLGDLTASAIKRYTGIKDFGGILPGHGGVMDRFDSVLFTAPAVYLMVRILLYIMERQGA